MCWDSHQVVFFFCFGCEVAKAKKENEYVSLNRVGKMQGMKLKISRKHYFLSTYMTKPFHSTLSYSLPPGEKFPPEMLQSLKSANAQYAKTRDFEQYRRKMATLLGHDPDANIGTESLKHYYGGFLEGEASVLVSVKKSEGSRFGAYFDPEFNVTQHVNGSLHLYFCLCYFRTGLIRHKNKSNATLVYTIDNRQTLKEKVVPFYREYVNPNACRPKRERFENWVKMLDLFDQDAHLDYKRFVYEMGPIWDKMRMQKGQKNETFPSFEDFEQYVYHFVQEKNKRR